MKKRIGMFSCLFSLGSFGDVLELGSQRGLRQGQSATKTSKKPINDHELNRWRLEVKFWNTCVSFNSPVAWLTLDIASLDRLHKDGAFTTSIDDLSARLGLLRGGARRWVDGLVALDCLFVQFCRHSIQMYSSIIDKLVFIRDKWLVFKNRKR